MKVFITGGTGVIGRRLIPLLREAGHEVVAPRHSELNLEDRAALSEALDGVNAAYHLATRIATGARAGDPALWAENDRLRGIVTDLIVDAAIDRGVQTLIYPSITFLYPASGPATEDTPWHTDDPTRQSSEIAEGAVQRFRWGWPARRDRAVRAVLGAGRRDDSAGQPLRRDDSPRRRGDGDGRGA